MIDYFIRFIERISEGINVAKNIYSYLVRLYVHKLSLVRNAQVISNSKVRFIFCHFGYKNINSILSKNENDVVVCFESKACHYLAKHNIKYFHYKECWTNIETDLKIQSEVLNKVKSIPAAMKSIKVQYYEYLLMRERFLYFLSHVKDSKGSVTYLIDSRSILTVPVFDYAEYLLQNEFTFCTIVSFFGKCFVLGKRGKAINSSSISKLKPGQVLKEILDFTKKVIEKIKETTWKICHYICRNLFHLFLFKKKAIPAIHEKPASNNSPIAILYSGQVDTKYWKALFALVNEFENKAVQYLCIVDDPLTYNFMLLKGVNCFQLKSDKEQLGIHDVEMGKFTDTWRFGDYVLHQDSKLINLKKVLSQFCVKKIFLLPHWSSLGSLAVALQDDEKYRSVELISLPLVTVNGNHASIIGWDALSKIYCYGYQCLAAFKKMNYPEEMLILCGNILLDPYVKKIGEHQKRNNTILIATSRLDENENIWIEKVLQHAMENGYKCIIKVHPSFSKQDYALLKKKCANLEIITNIPDLYELILKCDLCITDCSTVGAEAAILRKMLLVVNLMDKDYNANQYEKFGIALKAKTLDEVILCLDKLLFDVVTQEQLKSNHNDFYHQYNYLNDGNAVSRLVSGLLS